MDQLGDIVVACRRNQDCAGLFAAMYRAVSSQVRQAVREGGLFADDASLEAFAVRFADRYLDAYRTYRRGARALEVGSLRSTTERPGAAG